MAETKKREFKASARHVRMSARKARLVMDAVRGRDAEEAMVMLQFVNKRAAPVIRKLIESAVANAEEFGNREGVDIDTGELVIADAQVNEGSRHNMKRWRPRSRGSAAQFLRYSCHMSVVLAERAALEERAKGRPAFAKPRRRLSKEQRLAKKGIVAQPAEKPAAAATAEAAVESSAKKVPAKTGAKAVKEGKKAAVGKSEKKPVKKSEKKSGAAKAKKAPAKKKK